MVSIWHLTQGEGKKKTMGKKVEQTKFSSFTSHFFMFGKQNEKTEPAEIIIKKEKYPVNVLFHALKQIKIILFWTTPSSLLLL